MFNSNQTLNLAGGCLAGRFGWTYNQIAEFLITSLVSTQPIHLVVDQALLRLI